MHAYYLIYAKGHYPAGKFVDRFQNMSHTTHSKGSDPLVNPIFTDKIGQQIKTLNILVAKELSNNLKNVGVELTSTQATVLAMLDASQNNQLRQKALEASLQLSHPTTRGIVKRLVAAGLVETTTLLSDRRQVWLLLTVDGQKLIARDLPQIKRQRAAVEAKLLHQIPETEWELFSHTLAKMIRNMEV